MTAITRRSHAFPVSPVVTLATADDLDGTTDGTQVYDIGGAQRVLILQVNDGTAGTAGIDQIQVSKDGGENWVADSTLMAVSQNDATGDIVTNALLNAAGTEPTLYAAFKGGPYEGPTLIRCVRDSDVSSVSDEWVTGAPSVLMIVFGVSPAAPDTLA